MKNLAVELLKWFLVLGIIYPVYAQKDSDARKAEGFHNIKINLVGLRRVIQEAGIVQRLKWAGISLINPDSQSKPIFLYAYRILDLTDSYEHFR